jgi:uncharacterized membrane protein YidH (DUF202 family)
VAEDGRVPPVGEVWDEGLSPERTELAWGRTGLALLVAVGVLARRAWTLSGWIEVAAVTMIGVGGLVWLVGMRLSRDLHLTMEPHGLDGRKAFAVMTAGTLLLAFGGLVFGIVLHR